MKKTLIKIAPEKAKELLLNHRNRPLNQQIVDAMVMDMKNNSFDNETYVVLNEDGTLNYGQHTLSAIIKYGNEFNVNVITLEKDDNHLKGYYNNNSRYKY